MTGATRANVLLAYMSTMSRCSSECPPRRRQYPFTSVDAKQCQSNARRWLRDRCRHPNCIVFGRTDKLEHLD